jgi:hypothetical protein
MKQKGTVKEEADAPLQRVVPQEKGLKPEVVRLVAALDCHA